MKKTPLEQWIAEKMGAKDDPALTAATIGRYQLEKLRQTVDYAREKSSFYRGHLLQFRTETLQSLDDIALLPFTTPRDIIENHLGLLCTSQGEIERVVTLLVPGMTDEPRRVYFTAEDLELTVDFFHRGMSTFVNPGQKVLILMPGQLPGSVGDLLVKGLRRMNVEGIVHGLVREPADAINDICRYEIDCLVGIPAQVLSIARHPASDTIEPGRLKSILLSSDYVPAAIVRELGATWGCSVFNHYGTTEMGLGGAVECEALAGYHLREADLYFEIVDPDSGAPQPPGATGEIVFTTLTRIGMPLIRYRTGDVARFLPEPCPCGTVLRRMDKVRGRLSEMVRLPTGDWLGIQDLDEVLFPFPEIVNYSATLIRHDDADRLKIEIYPKPGGIHPSQESLEAALRTLPQIHAAETAGCLRLEPVGFSAENWVTTGVAKRSIALAQKGARERAG